MALKSEDKPEWQLLQLVLSYPEPTRALTEALNLDLFSDERVRDLIDCVQALLMDGRPLSLRDLAERVPASLADSLAAVETAEGEEEGRMLRRFSDYTDALELRRLRRELASARTLTESLEIQKRIKALNAGRVG